MHVSRISRPAILLSFALTAFAASAFTLVGPGSGARVVVSPELPGCVWRAAQDLTNDVRKITGVDLAPRPSHFSTPPIPCPRRCAATSSRRGRSRWNGRRTTRSLPRRLLRTSGLSCLCAELRTKALCLREMNGASVRRRERQESPDISGSPGCASARNARTSGCRSSTRGDG